VPDRAAVAAVVHHLIRRCLRRRVIGDPDVLVEIADWESAEARDGHMKEAAATGAYAPLLELLAAPFRVTVTSQLA